MVEQIRGLGRRAVGVAADVSDRSQVESMVQQAERVLGPLDVLVNNAGIGTIVPLVDLTDEQWERVTAVNPKGSWLCAQVVARGMIAGKRRGAIVNVARSKQGPRCPEEPTTHRPNAAWRD